MIFPLSAGNGPDMDLQFYITAFVTLFVVIDPVGLAPLFLALTPDADAAHRRAVGIRALTIGFGVLMVFGIFGEAVLNFAGISMPAFRIAGGILLFLTALDMLFERRTQRREGQHPQANDPSVFPLATPLIAGPGAIATMILLMGQTTTLTDKFMVNGVMASVLLITAAFFAGAGLMERALGKVGINVATRLLGMMLAALAVQFVVDGLRDLGAMG